MTTLPPQSLDALVSDILAVIEIMGSIPNAKDRALEDYRKTCLDIPEQVNSGMIKVAVVGVIKSGKSTFINSYVGKELVKRGAGVVTSITTRIRKGKKNRACLRLKSWDEINHLLGKNLEMFPHDGNHPPGAFDLRRKKDREYLGMVHESLVKASPVTGEGVRPEVLLIRNALEGYKECCDLVGADEEQITFVGKSFDRHKRYTGDPAMAFYLKDACLELFGKTIDPQIEIADCQGADSTDPSQMAQIINYIESANLIVYCISSRTGLRKSDMDFLKVIKRLGLLKNLLFINNCDLSEHENLTDLKLIEEGIRRELTLLTDDPRLFSFSSLFNLFQTQGTKITRRNAKLLELWNDDRAMADYTRKNTESFYHDFFKLLEDNFNDLLLSNHLERLGMMVSSLDQKTDLISKVLKDDLEEQKEAREKLKEVGENASRLQSIVKNSVEGAVEGLTREILANLETAFAKDSVAIGKKVKDFIRITPIDVEPYRVRIKELGFQQILYLMFQDFKRQLDLFTLEQIVPELKSLVAVQEERISNYFQSLLDSYQIDFLGFAVDAGETSLQLDCGNLNKDWNSKELITLPVDIKGIKKILGLELPQTEFSASYTQKIRATAMADLGFKSLIVLISSILDKHTRFSFNPGFDRAVSKIKKETLSTIRVQISEYHEQLTKAYFIPLIKAATRDFTDKIHQRFDLYTAMNQDMDKLFTMNQSEKSKNRKKILTIKSKIKGIRADLAVFSQGGHSHKAC